jgi:hypothetical protein
MGHVARGKMEKARPDFAAPFPKSLVNKLSTTLKKIWIAKDAHAGGASRNMASILDTLIEASKDTGGEFVSTVLALTQQNPSSSSEPSSLPIPLVQPSQPFEPRSTMAFQRVDPRPFAPPGFHHHEVQNNATMAQAVMRPPPRVHEDYAIISIDPIPPIPLQFQTVREVVEEFLDEHMHVGFRDIRPTHLGQALVRFENIFDRGMLVNNSPPIWGGGLICMWFITMKHKTRELFNSIKSVG